MGRQFLAYWKPEGLNFLQYTQFKVPYLGSDQLAKRGIKAGDRIWATTLRGERLNMIAPLVVGEIVGPERARELIGASAIYQSKWYAIGAGDAQTVRQFSIDELVDQIRFVGSNDHLMRTGQGRVDAKQLQTIRELTEDSANLLEGVWQRRLAAGEESRTLGDTFIKGTHG